MNNIIMELDTPMLDCENDNQEMNFDDFFDLIEVVEEEYTLDDFIAIMYCEQSDIDAWFDLMEELEETKYNDTELWLFDANCQNYERVRKYILNRAPNSHRWSQPACDVESHFNDFLYDEKTGLITKNQLKKKLAKGEKIKDSVLYEWFLQFCVRDKFKSAQDCQNRALGAKTQSESEKIKAYDAGLVDTKYQHQHDIKEMDNNGFRVANVMVKKHKDTGETIGSPEIILNDLECVESNLEIQSSHDHMKRLCHRKWGSDKGDRMYRLYIDLVEEKYSSRKVWAKALNISYKSLITNIEKVRDLFKSNLSDFGLYY